MNNLKIKLKMSCFYLIIVVAAFFIIRLSLFLLCFDYFSTLSNNEIFLSFLNGFRFDFSSIAIFILPLVVFLFIPVNSKAYTKVISTLMWLMFFVTLLVLAGDVVFFSIFNKHLETELLSVQTHFSFILQMALQSYWYVTFSIFLLFFITLYFTYKYINKNFTAQKPQKFLLNSILIILCIGVIMLACIRGKWDFKGKPLGIMDAQLLGSQKTSELILNGIFSSAEGLRRMEDRTCFLDKQEAINLAKNITSSEQEIDSDYPFYRYRKDFSFDTGDYNIVIIFLESWEREYYEQYPEAMPNFVEITKNSLYFKNFYNSGSRSLTSTTSTMFSIPYVWGLPFITNGLGAKNMSRMASYFKNKEYSTVFVATDKASADKIGEVANYSHFDRFYAKENIPVTHKYPTYTKGFDWEGFELFFNEINSFKNNFLGFFYTSSTHGPWDMILSEEYKMYPQTTRDNQFLNRLCYSDAAMGNFFKLAKQQPWFDKTIFLIFPDHHVPFPNRTYDPNLRDADKYFTSFLAIYAPKIFKPQQIDTYATQEDILPTIIDLVHSSQPYSSDTNSIFDKERAKEIYIYAENKKVYIVGPDIYEEIDLSNINKVKEMIAQNRLSYYQKKAIARNEAIYHSLQNHKWHKKSSQI